MAQRCGDCHGEGTYGGKRCHCQGPRKPYFAPKKAKAKAEYAFKSGHRHTPGKLVQETPSGLWFECDGCDEMYKVTA